MQRRHVYLGLVVVPYTLGALAVSIWQKNVEFVYYSVVLIGIVAAVWWMDRRIRMPLIVLWGLALWGLVHLLGGIVPIPVSITEPGSNPNLYNMRLAPWLPKYDQVVHALGFGIAAIAAWTGLRSAFHTRPRGGVGIGLWFAIVLMGMGLGAINEVVEFIATRLFPWTNVGGYDNTGWDLIANLTGCLAAATWVAWSENRRTQPAD